MAAAEILNSETPPEDPEKQQRPFARSNEQCDGSIQETQSQSLFAILTRRRYVNGWKRPLTRGWLHALILVLLMVGSALVPYWLSIGYVHHDWWRVEVMLLGKLVSHFASVMYHIYPHKSEDSLFAWIKFDASVVCVAIWAPANVFSLHMCEWWLSFAVMAAVTVICYLLTQFEYREPVQVVGKYGEEGSIAFKGARAVRGALTSALFAWCLFVTGWHYGYHEFWTVCLVLYTIGFACGPMLYNLYPPAPWHLKGQSGWHEDFHMLIALGDAFCFMMAIWYLRDPHVHYREPICLR